MGKRAHYLSVRLSEDEWHRYDLILESYLFSNPIWSVNVDREADKSAKFRELLHVLVPASKARGLGLTKDERTLQDGMRMAEAMGREADAEIFERMDQSARARGILRD